MKNLSMLRIFAILAVTAIFIALPASAQATRTWVSGVGDDANPCSRTAPCKTFPGAISKTAAGGEINVLDPGGFGAVTITKSISIIAEGVEAGVLVSGTNAIIVNVLATDRVILKGLDIEGLGTGLNGIRFIGGGSLHVEDCSINNFVQKGIDFEPAAAGASSLFVSNTVIRNNANAANGGGIFIKPGALANAVGTISGVRLEKNKFGVRVEDRSRVTIENTLATQHATNGFIGVSTGPEVVMLLDNVVSSANFIGVRTEGAGTKAFLTGCTITGNSTGVDPFGGVINSWQNNFVSGNTVDGVPNGVINPK